MPDKEDGLLVSRQTKLNRLRQNGIDPYPPRYKRTHEAAQAISEFEHSESNEQASPTQESVSIAGRLVSMRTMGKASFLDIRDSSSTIQALLRQNNVGSAYDTIKDLDIGDFLGVTGKIMRTRTGQITVDAEEFTLLSKECALCQKNGTG